jgi:NitT/TauT family transport system permease protein
MASKSSSVSIFNVRFLETFALPMISAAIWLILWQLTVWWFSLPSVIAPAPTQVFAILFGSQLPDLLTNGFYTGIEAIAGFGLACLVGLLLALGIARYPRFREAVYPYLIGFQVIPKLALAPLFVLWFGIGLTSRIAFASFICFFPIVIATYTGLRSVEPTIINMARSVGASETQILYEIRVPFSVRYIFAGLRLAATSSIIGVVIAEFISADRGLGYVILSAGAHSDTPVVVTSIVLLCVLGLLLYATVVLVERVFFGRFLT